MMATGFMGYVLVWGQMSFWAATVITNLFSAIPGVGDTIVTWLWGGYAVGNPTLNRFYSLHYLLPFVIAGVVVLHIWALHVVGQNNPDRHRAASRTKTPWRSRPTRRSRTASSWRRSVILYAWFVFYIPNFLSHADNYIPANPAVTPTHIVPEWYYLPFYAILRAIPDKLMGVIALGRLDLWFWRFMPWLDTSRVRSARYRPLFKQFFWLFVIVCVGLGWLGSKPPEGIYVILSRVFTIYYFAFSWSSCRCSASSRKPSRCRIRFRDRFWARKREREHGHEDAAHNHRLALAGRRFVDRAGAACDRPRADTPTPPRLKWSFAGPFGRYDQGQLQRGFKIYKEVCAVCHSIQMLAFRNLAEPGGPGFSEAQAAAVAR